MGRTYTVSVSQAGLPKAQRWSVSFLRGVATTTLRLACPSSAEMALTLTHDQHMQELNERYRGLASATDVLAFAMEEGPEFQLPSELPRQLGDVVVSLDTVQRNASESGNSLQSELAWVICHGTLHLLGYDHQTPEQLWKMRTCEREILENLAIERSWPELWA